MRRAAYLNTESGFTIVELVVTATFVAAASAAIVGIFITVGNLNRQSRDIALATAAAQQKLETYRDAGYNAVPIGTPAETFTSSLPASLSGPKTAVANVTVSQAGLKQVEVVVTFRDSGRTRTVKLTTLMAQRGINR